ncbi:MAG: hypothetical protein IKE24_13290 [Clostridia bacterium]|nr:hypothetical protein [Clostridia bacterium]
MNQRPLTETDSLPRELCRVCGKKLTADDIGLTRKLINRGARSCFCIGCLAARFQVSEETLREKIREFRRMGCTLFPPEE